MTELYNSRLINELFDNASIIDRDLNLVFLGSSLKQILQSHNIESEIFQPDGSSLNSQNQSLIEKIKSVYQSKKPASLRFNDLETQLVVVPFSDGVVFGLKEKVSCITKIEHDLKERVKELECLYNISKESDSKKTLDEFLESSTKHIEAGFQYPSDTVVNIELGNKTYGNIIPDIKGTSDLFISSIIIKNKNRGEVKIYIKKGLGILDEERKLIDEIAGKFSRIIEKEEETRYLEKQQKILTAKNEALIKMTEECGNRREELRIFFRAITDKIVVIDRDFNILMSNKDEIGDSGKCYNKLFNLEQRCSNCSAVETFETAKDSINESEYNERCYMLRTYPILGANNHVERVLEVCGDITERKNMEDQLLQSNKLASLGKLVAGVAHEINNPNTFILGNLKIVQEAFEDILPILDQYYLDKNDLKIARLGYELFKENITVLVNDMINGANRTKKIVGDLRNFAKKDESGQFDAVDLNDIIRNSLSLTQKQIKKHAQLDIELNDAIPNFIGNTYKIEQVIVNLIMNASEAIEHDLGIIKIKTDYDKVNKEDLLIISDNGIGIDESTIKNIFDPFYTTKRNRGGTGLGLSITYGIIKDHNGKIEVNSKPGVGTTFVIHFPVKQGNLDD